MQIYHNPRCSKSRNGLQYLEQNGYEFKVKKYLSEGISVDELREVISKTGKKPFDFVRTHESEYKAKYKGKELSDEEWLIVLSKNPKLLHRPIVVKGDKAVLANPPENIQSVL